MIGKMNVIFVTLSNINSITERGIYADLMRKFRDEGHQVFIVSPVERRMGQKSHVIDADGVKILKVRTLNIQKTNVIEKGIGTLLIENQYQKAIKKHLKGIGFDLILYSTPPITFTNVVRFLKKRNPKAISYLLLKDIFPQNAVDIGMMPGEGYRLQVPDYRSWINLFKYQLYKYFRKKEKELYAISDYIGCMSPANVEYVLKHNNFVDKDRVEVAPNAHEFIEKKMEDSQVSAERKFIREKYNLHTDKPIFIYGGNLGKPQGIDYLIKCLDANKQRQDCYFVVVGNGTEYGKLDVWFKTQDSGINVKLMQRLPVEDYEMLVHYCDVGLIFLDHRFTIPNYPSRLLSYLEKKMPVLCATDVNTDMGRIAEDNGYGYWCESVKPEDFTALVDKMLASDRKSMGEKGYQFLKENYLVENTYNAIMRHF